MSRPKLHAHEANEKRQAEGIMYCVLMTSTSIALNLVDACARVLQRS